MEKITYFRKGKVFVIFSDLFIVKITLFRFIAEKAFSYFVFLILILILFGPSSLKTILIVCSNFNLLSESILVINGGDIISIRCWLHKALLCNNSRAPLLINWIELP